MHDDLDLTSIHTIRTLSMDAVQAARSGHPGTPMALAPVIYGLWQHRLRYDVEDAGWADRDRFVLSCGHASMLLYATLHLAGVQQSSGDEAVSLDEIRNFRQLGSLTPGHPEHGHTAGVEMTTGPLGQGVATSVGMALAKRWLAARYNRPGFELFQHRVFVLCSDGDLMEGVSGEAASFAGHQGLADLCWLWDDNKITIDGGTDLAFTEDVAKRFEGFGWNVLRVDDAEDAAALQAALDGFERETERPTLICVKSHIGFGSPNRQDTSKAHGEPLGEDEVRLTKQAYGWPDETFRVPDGVRERFAEKLGARGRATREAWDELFGRYRAEHADAAAELDVLLAGGLPDGWDADAPTFPADDKGQATRASSGKALNAFAARVPWMLGGSADLAPSNKTELTFDGAGLQTPGEPAGRNLHFGVREHAMASIANGMALSGLRPYGGTFLIFSDYMRPAQRLAAMMKLPVTYVFTHDSIGVGEDGPTHQPVEQLPALRAIPGMHVVRPADANETAEAWKAALRYGDGPTSLVLTRQNLPVFDRTRYASAEGLHKGAYVLADSATSVDPQVILIGTGSEVSLCVAAFERLVDERITARVVSMPSWELFAEQDEAYRESVLPRAVTARVAVEQASGFGWSRWVGERGEVVCMTGFGASAPYADLQQHFGFTVDNVVRAVRKQLALTTA